MSGISVMIDTNIAIALLNGDETIAEMFDGKDVMKAPKNTLRNTSAWLKK